MMYRSKKDYELKKNIENLNWKRFPHRHYFLSIFPEEKTNETK